MPRCSFWALTPIFVFLALFVGYGVWTGDFYAMPAIAGFVVALTVAFLMDRKRTFAEKLDIAARGMGDENVMVMCLVFIMAGAFSGSIGAAGGAESTVNFALSVLPPSVAVLGIYLVGCFISIAMGTSVGTITVLAPIAVGIAEHTEIPTALCLGAAVSGAMFGDNLSMISDTTIAATRTQGCAMGEKFRENIRLVLPAAVLTAGILLALSLCAGDAGEIRAGDYDVVRILPYLAVLIGALMGFNVILLLAGGTLFSLIVGLCYGDFALTEIFSVMGKGVMSMYDITVISIVVAATLALIRANGGIEWILKTVRRGVKSRKGAEVGIAALSAAVDCATANNTVAIVIAAPVAKEIATEYKIEPGRTASLLDIFTSVFQGLIPYGAQLLTAAAFAEAVSPVQVVPYCIYPMLMGVSALLFVVFGRRDRVFG